VCADSHGAIARSATATAAAAPIATAVLRAMMRPARSGSVCRNSATYFVAVRPSPIPANTPHMPTVLWIMPYWPNCSRPNSLAVATEAARLDPWDMAAPTTDQTAPRVNRPRRESAVHTPLIAFVAPLHDLISVIIKNNLLASAWAAARDFRNYLKTAPDPRAIGTTINEDCAHAPAR
jgi:hypothetical protein